jgi:hypothetical protein
MKTPRLKRFCETAITNDAESAFDLRFPHQLNSYAWFLCGQCMAFALACIIDV